MELGPVDRITADAVGEPGMRTFYIQAREGDQLITVIVEKAQVQLLASSILELLADVELETETGPDDDAMALEEPIEALWRAGRLSIGYDHERDLFLLELQEYRPDEDEEEDDPRSLLEGEGETIRIWARRDQMLAVSRYGTRVAERGRPTCPFCGNPMDPEGHACPATNGHRAPRP